MKRLLLIGLLFGCAGEVRTVARPSDRSDLIDPSDPISQLRARCRTNGEACVELSALPIIASASQASCDRGDPDACVVLGLAYTDGRGVAGNRAHGLQLLKRACATGHLGACGLAGTAHATGAGTTVDIQSAIRLYTRACDGGEAGSCSLLGQIHEHGQGLPQDRQAAARLYTRACGLGLGAGCRNRAILLSKAKRPDQAKICSLFAAGCEGNDDRACELVASECAASHPEASDNRSRYSLMNEDCRSHGLLARWVCHDAGKLCEGSPGVAACRQSRRLPRGQARPAERASLVRHPGLLSRRGSLMRRSQRGPRDHHEDDRPAPASMAERLASVRRAG